MVSGERLYAMNLDTSVDSEVQMPTGASTASADTSVSEVEESPLCNGTLPVMDDDQPANDSSGINLQFFFKFSYPMKFFMK